MSRLVAAFDLLLVISAFLQCQRIRRTRRFVEDRRRVTGRGSQGFVVVMVSLWREQGTAAALWSRWSDLSDTRPWLRVMLLANDDDWIAGSADSTVSALVAARAARPAASDQVQIVRCPSDVVTKARKLHHASRLLPDLNICAVGLFDVDSEPDPRALDWVRARMAQRDHSDVVMQQLVLNREQTLQPSMALRHHVLRQNRWAMHFEVGRLFSRARPRWAERFIYVIGHGSFFSPGAFRKALPRADEPLEDALMSLQLRLEGTSMEAIPYVEWCDAPPTLSEVARQKARWWHGPSRAWRYCRVLRGADDRRARQLSLVSHATKLWLHAVYWIAGPVWYLLVAPCALLVGGGLQRPALLGAHATALLVHAWGVDAYSHRALRRITGGIRARSVSPVHSLATWARWGAWPLLISASDRLPRPAPVRTTRVWEVAER